MECTYQYCPPESTRYISSEDSLRCSSLVGLGMRMNTEREESEPCTGQTVNARIGNKEKQKNSFPTWELAFRLSALGK